MSSSWLIEQVDGSFWKRAEMICKQVFMIIKARLEKEEEGGSGLDTETVSGAIVAVVALK